MGVEMSCNSTIYISLIFIFICEAKKWQIHTQSDTGIKLME
jgi:hypothetical protein